MKILMISSYLPHPLHSGGHIRLYNLLKQLGNKHEITLICEKRPQQTQEDIQSVKKFCKDVVVVKRKKQWSIRNMLKAGISPYPFLLVGHASSDMTQAIAKALKEDFAVIHIETFYVFQNLPAAAFTIPTVLVEHNIEYMVYRRYATRAPLWLRPLLTIDIKKMEFWEKKFWQKATKLVAVSEEEKRIMKRSDVAIVPNGVNIDQFTFKEKNNNQKRILYIGDYKWLQNKDAALWIINEIWPKIKEKMIQRGIFDDVILWIVGKHIPSGWKKNTDTSIVFDEHAPKKTEDIFQQSEVLLAPKRVGGGTSYKIIEAMASGVPVVTTSLGIEGLSITSGKHILVADSANDIAQHVVSLFSDKEKEKSLVKNARILIEEKYDWNIIAKQLEAVYTAAVKE